MTCKEIRRYLPDYAIEVYKKPWIEKVYQHILICKDCRKEKENLVKTLSMMDKLKPKKPSQNIYKKILGRLGVSKLKVAGALVAGILIAIFVFTKVKVKTKTYVVPAYTICDTSMFYTTISTMMVGY